MSSAQQSPVVSTPRKRARPGKDTLPSSGSAKRRKTDDVYEFRDDDERSSIEQSPSRQLLSESPLNQESSRSDIQKISALSSAAAPRKQEKRGENLVTPTNDPSHEDMTVRLPGDEEDSLADGITIQNSMQRSGSNRDGAPGNQAVITPQKRRRGRPRKNHVTPSNIEVQEDTAVNDTRAVYTPSVDIAVEAQPSSAVTRKPGRPRKNTLTPDGTALQTSVDGGTPNGMEDGSLTGGRGHSIQRSSVDGADALFPTTVKPRKRGRPRINPLSANGTTVERRVGFGLPGGEDDELNLADISTPHAGAPIPALNGNPGVLKRIVLEKLTGKRRIQLIGMDDEYKKVYQLLEQTVVAGEGNSMLVVGARGSGKTTLVETIISKISAQHKENFHTVRLNGFIHTDDKLALREIWRQLGKEMEVDEDLTGKTNNYADTLSSLLALLSHPSELSENIDNEAAKSVIFILEEFDLFASHPRQTLLYNLFDIAQGRKAPVAVLGLTTKIDIVETLEKRVKSRFSHRSVLLSLPKSLTAFWEICKEALLVREDDLQSPGEREALNFDSDDGLTQIWNGIVAELWNESSFKRLLESIFFKTKGVKDFYVECLMPIISLSSQNLRLTGHSFLKGSLSAPESKLHILEGLSDLELSLLIAAARLDIILDTDTCNFNMAYDEYTTLASRVRLQSSASGAAAVGAGSKIWGREVAMGAWERLPEYGLIVPAIGAAGLGAAGGATGAGGGAGTRDVGRMGKMFRVDVALEEIWQSVSGLGAVMTKWCKEI